MQKLKKELDDHETLHGMESNCTHQLVSKPIATDSEFLVWCAVLLQTHQEQATHFSVKLSVLYHDSFYH